MFKIKSKILKKLSAGFMAGLCVFSMLGSSMSGVITANASSTSTENSAFPSADTVIAKAATLLGSPYTFGNKGYWYAYNQSLLEQMKTEFQDRLTSVQQVLSGTLSVCRPDKLTSQIYATFKNGQYKYLADYALAGSAFFIAGNSENTMFDKLRCKLKTEYKPYTDKCKKAQKQRNLQHCVQDVLRDLKQTSRTREQSVNTAKLLYRLADNAVRLSVEETLSVPIQEHIEDMDIGSEPEPCMEFS